MRIMLRRCQLRVVLYKPFLQRGEVLRPHIVVLMLERHDDRGHLLLMSLGIHVCPMVSEALNDVLAVWPAVPHGQPFVVRVRAFRKLWRSVSRTFAMST